MVLEPLPAFYQPKGSNDAVRAVTHSGELGAFEIMHRRRMHQRAIPSILDNRSRAHQPPSDGNYQHRNGTSHHERDDALGR